MPVHHMAEADMLQLVADLLHHRVTGFAAGAQAIGDVFGDGLVGKQGVILEHHADIAPMRRQPGHVVRLEIEISLRRLDEAGDGAQQGCLAAARGAEQREEAAFRYRQA